MLRFDLYAAGVIAPGVNSLDELLAMRRSGPLPSVAGIELPSPKSLPANERRRASQVVRLTLACAEQALEASPFAVEQLRMVFASDEGTGEVCQQMLESLATTRAVSPLVFHNSVHNAPSGYFSIGHQNQQSAVSVSLGHESFASGLLCAVAEAQTSGQPVLFLSYDASMPEPLRGVLPIAQATATAWIIASALQPMCGRPPIARFDVELCDAIADADDATPDWMPAGWSSNSSAEAFRVLAMLDGRDATCEMPLGAQRLRVTRVSEFSEAATC